MPKTLRTNLGLAFLRICASALLMSHGFGKFMKLINGDFEFPDPLGIGATPTLFLVVIGEFICPILVILGYKTRWMAIPPAITMLVAAVVVHSADPFGVKEKALLFLVMFISIILLGPGKYSIDGK